MNIFDFFTSLLPRFGRNEIIEDIDALQSETHDELLPVLKSVAALRPKGKWVSPKGRSAEDVFLYTLPEFNRLGLSDGLFRIFFYAPKALEVIREMAMADFAKDVTKESITYRKSNVLRYLEIYRFASKYALIYVNRLLAAEALVVRGKPDTSDESIVPVEKRWLDQNYEAFMKALVLIAVDARDLKKTLAEIPDITIIDKKKEIVEQMVGKKSLDPLRMGFISAQWNPIYHIRMQFAEWQVKRYNERREEKRQIELRLLDLKNADRGIEDPKLEEKIEYNESRLQDLKAILYDTERDFGLV